MPMIKTDYMPLQTISEAGTQTFSTSFEVFEVALDVLIDLNHVSFSESPSGQVRGGLYKYANASK